jgi:hypothetical protein
MLVKQTDKSDFVFGAVFDTVDIGLVLVDSMRSIVAWNEGIARVSRRTAQDVVAKASTTYFPRYSTRLPSVIDDAFERAAQAS